jgi:isoquinoline 1-oxidoreductase beta subunit
VQIPDAARQAAAKVTGVPQDRATLHQLRIGGGFGRRLMHEYACEAAAISKQAGGIPVKLMWTREDDMSHDFYRPGGFHQFKAALDEKGRLTAWSGHAISFTDSRAPAPPAGRQPASVAGGGWPSPNEFPAEYTPNYRLSVTNQPFSIPCGPWRAPGSNTTGFVVQSFMHELALAYKRSRRVPDRRNGQAAGAAPAAGGPGWCFGGAAEPDRAIAVIGSAASARVTASRCRPVAITASRSISATRAASPKWLK